MGHPAITLSTLDPAGACLLQIYKEIGFEPTDNQEILYYDKIYLVPINSLIVPEEEYKTPEKYPYPIDYDKIASELDIDYYVAASRHWAKSGKPCFTVHPTGNFGRGMYGGNDHELQNTLANPMRNVFQELKEAPPKKIQVTLEVTHHSPTYFKTPMFFAEIGSRIEQWHDQKKIKYLAEAIISGIKSKEKAPGAIGFGGGHYCPTFSVKEEEYAFGHMVAKYSFDDLDKEIVNQMIERTLDGVEFAIFDLGLKGKGKRIALENLRDVNLEII
jgi:D-aminoacyl-tRNA deacylase